MREWVDGNLERRCVGETYSNSTVSLLGRNEVLIFVTLLHVLRRRSFALSFLHLSSPLRWDTFETSFVAKYIEYVDLSVSDIPNVGDKKVQNRDCPPRKGKEMSICTVVIGYNPTVIKCHFWIGKIRRYIRYVSQGGRHYIWCLCLLYWQSRV